MAEATIEIARRDWHRVLDEFNAIHEGWLVTVDVLSAAFGAQTEIANLPLVGIMVEGHRPDSLAVAAGFHDDHIVHRIESPQRLWIARLDERVDAAVEIESADGTKTIVRFKSPMLPETVDGASRRSTTGGATR